MFSSGSGIGNPFSYTNETLFTDTPTNIQENPNYNSLQEEYPPPLLLHFPSPFPDTGTKSSSNPNPNTDPKPNPNSRRRTGKKDRHSKICTAQGLRDRRMRLSVQIARKFFDLQDLLGFDKASKTIEWLFSKSKGAIKEVKRNILPRVNHGCRAVRAKAVVLEDQENDVHHKEDKGKGIRVNKKIRKKAVASYDPHQAKEWRDKARERARARTFEKMIIRGLGDWKEGRGDWKEDDLEGNPNNGLDHEFPDDENFHGTSGSANSSHAQSRSILGFQTNSGVSDGEDRNNKFMGVGGNWEMENARLIMSDYGELTNIVHMTGNELQEQNPSPISATNAYFQSQLNQFYYRWQ